MTLAIGIFEFMFRTQFHFLFFVIFSPIAVVCQLNCLLFLVTLAAHFAISVRLVARIYLFIYFFWGGGEGLKNITHSTKLERFVVRESRYRYANTIYEYIT